MATINLLPWREERREEQKKEYLIILASVAVLAVLIVLGWQTYLNASIANQTERNTLLQSRIKELDEQVKEIDELKKKRQELVARMEVIQSLQGNRPEIVHVFDEIVRTLPDGVFYNAITRKEVDVELKGTAESNNRVSSLMRQLDVSDWFGAPELKLVKANKGFGPDANDFEMHVKLDKPEENKLAAEKAAEKAGATTAAAVAPAAPASAPAAAK